MGNLQEAALLLLHQCYPRRERKKESCACAGLLLVVLMALPGGCFLVAMSLPKPVADGGQKDDECADHAVHERVAESGGDAAEQQGREADADVE